MPIKDIIARHNKYQDSVLHSFETNLHRIVLRAQGRVLSRLQLSLGITDGVIDSTPTNMRILRGAGAMFMQEMDKAGYEGLVTGFVDSFHGTLPFLQETVTLLGETVDQKWNTLGFTAKDLSLLVGVQANTVAALEGALRATAGAAVSRGLFGVAGMKFESLVETLTQRIETSIGKATSIGNTAMSVYFAQASDREYQIIAKGLPPNELRYRYSGPVDKLERPFCRHLTDADKAYTREQIGRMNNGQIPNVMISRGGWNCRHQWILDTSDLEASLAA